MSKLQELPLNEIRLGEVALREVDVKGPMYLQMVESIKNNIASGLPGIINPISVCPVHNTETNEKYFVVIDGAHRFTAATEAKMDKIPVHIIEASEGKVMAMQYQGNLIKVETKPAQYAKHIRRILVLDPALNITELAKRLGVSTSHISQRLSLGSLLDNIQKMVDDGKISLNNALALAKLPAEEQPEWLERAMQQDTATFCDAATARARAIREALRQGRKPGDEQFVAEPRLRKLADLKDELTTSTVGKSFVKTEKELSIWNKAIQWILQMDEETLNKKRAAFEAEKKQKEEAAAKRKEEMALKKQEAAKKEAEKAKAEIAAS